MMRRTQPEIKAGDIIGFTGGCWRSDFVNLVTYHIPRWGISHMGIVGQYNDELVLFESTTLSDIPCIIQGSLVQGTQACRLQDRVASYQGRVWHYPLYRRLYQAETDRLNTFLLDHIGIPYDMVGAVRSGGLAWSWFESWLHEEDLNSIFCSELCAASHRDIGLIRTDHVSRWNPNRMIRYERREHILAKPWRLMNEADSLRSIAGMCNRV